MLSSERAAIEGGGGGGAPATAPPRMLLRRLLLLAVLGALPLRIPHISEPALLPRLLVLQVVVHLLLHRLPLHRVPLGLRVGRPPLSSCPPSRSCSSDEMAFARKAFGFRKGESRQRRMHGMLHQHRCR